ncbi:MAG: PQQ-binding-like beta-propeller repeat protein [Pseudomonadota bacterium]
MNSAAFVPFIGKLQRALLLGVCAVSAVNAQDTGSALFAGACAQCHGTDGRGTPAAPSIVPRVASSTDDNLLAFLRTGSPEKGMPPAAVSREQLPVLVEYLHTLANAAPAVTAVQSSVTSLRTIDTFTPLTEAMLLNPHPEDWLWFSRTADAQRFSPLDQIDTTNVGNLALAWSRGLPNGLTYTIPLVYNGVMYLTTPDSAIQALDATNGDLIWEYRRSYANANMGAFGRSKTLSMFADMVYFTAPDGMLVALDARTGQLRWETATGARGNSAGSIVVKGKVISNGTCGSGPRDACVITAHDALTGKLVWQFHTTEGPDNSSGTDTWGNTPVEERLASPWGLPGSYDADTDLIYWGIANPMPTTRANRHKGDSSNVGYEAPTELYSNSTVALDPDTGELSWYYQHLPGDDWDLDMNEERTILSTKINPDPAHVRWINPNIERGSVRDVVVNVGEGGGLWLLDKHSGEFIWATPFPFDVDNFFLSAIDVETGRTHINQELLVDEPGENHLICYFNTRSFWPTAYNPEKNALYVPYIRNCLNMTSENPAAGTRERRVGAAEPGVPESELNGLAKVNLETGEITHWPYGRIPTNSAILATAGNVVFWGDINRRYQALNADTGDVLWETILGGPISVSNITYAVNGRQYVAVIAGNTLSQSSLTTAGAGPIPLQLDAQSGDAAIYVFALPTASATE